MSSRRRRTQPRAAYRQGSATPALVTSLIALALLLAAQCSDPSDEGSSGLFEGLVTPPALHLPKSASERLSSP
jgi:hypothetical protein